MTAASIHIALPMPSRWYCSCITSQCREETAIIAHCEKQILELLCVLKIWLDEILLSSMFFSYVTDYAEEI